MGVPIVQESIQTDNKTGEHISLKEKISYGMGDFGNGFMFDLGQLYLLKFFTDVAGVSAGAAAGIFLVSKLFAAICDPIVGSFVDYRKHIGPRGKFRPFLIVGSVLLAILTVLTFISPNISPTGKLIYAYASYMIWGIGYSIVNIPYGSLGAAITQDTIQRASLSSFRQAGSLGALFVTSVIVMPLILLFPNHHVGYPVVMGIMSFIGVIAFMICYRGTKERIVSQSGPKEKLSFGVIVHTFTTNKPLLVLVLMTIFTISAYNIKSALLIYFAEYNLGHVELMAYMNFIIIGSSLLGVLFLPKLVRRFGKRKTAMLGMLVSVIADSMNFFMPSNVYIFTILVPVFRSLVLVFLTGLPGPLSPISLTTVNGHPGSGKKGLPTRCLIFHANWLNPYPAFFPVSGWRLSGMSRMWFKPLERCSELKRCCVSILLLPCSLPCW